MIPDVAVYLGTVPFGLKSKENPHLSKVKVNFAPHLRPICGINATFLGHGRSLCSEVIFRTSSAKLAGIGIKLRTPPSKLVFRFLNPCPVVCGAAIRTTPENHSATKSAGSLESTRFASSNTWESRPEASR